MSRFLLLLVLVGWFAADSSRPHSIAMHLMAREVLIFGVFGLIVLIPALWSRVLARHVATSNLSRSLDRFNWGTAIARALIPIWFAVCVFALGWVQIVYRGLGPIARLPVALPAAFVGTLPALLTWAALWWATYPADRALREQSLLYQLQDDLPVHAPPSFWDYFESNLRMQILFTLVPVAMILLLRDVLSLGLSWMSGHPHRIGSALDAGGFAEWVALPISGAIVFIFAPELLRRILRTQPLPDSPLRRRLEELCARAKFRYRDILLWDTGNNVANAAVMGIVPRVRYILLSDVLLQTMTDQQIEAVFAHEAGHVVHRHIAWYVVFVIAAMAMMMFAGTLLDAMHVRFDFVPMALRDPLMLALSVGVFCLLFGLLSRCFERQADVFAARTMQRELASEQHFHVGEDGASLFASALRRVAIVNNIPIRARNFSHGSIAQRMNYLRHLSDDPAKTRRFDRLMSTVFRLLGATFIFSVAWIGWMIWKG